MKLYIIVELYGGTYQGIRLITRNEKLADDTFKKLQEDVIGSEINFESEEEFDEEWEIEMDMTDNQEFYYSTYDLEKEE